MMLRRRILFLFFLLTSMVPLMTLAQVNFYDPSKLQKIELYFSNSNWDYRMDTAYVGSGEYIPATRVIVNGTVFDSVGVRFKGNSSYDSTYKKNPMHIELNTYHQQNYQGLTDIKLGNEYADPSLIREALSYEILRNYMDCPRANLAQLFVNGKYQGLYSNQESITKPYIGNISGNGTNTLFKCNPTINPGPANKCNLKFINQDSSSYFNFYDLKSDYGWNELVRLSDTITNYPSQIADHIDIDKFLWMLAFNNLFVNLDSYSGAFCQNYYLYKDLNGLFAPVIWDLNMSFGGFPFSGTPNNGLGSLNVTGMQQLSFNLHAGQADWPVINALLAHAQYKRMYVAHMRSILDDYFSNGKYKTMAAAWQSVADSAALSDSNSFFNYTAFQNGLTANTINGSYTIPGISNLMDARVTYLNNTSELQQAEPVISSITTSNNAPQLNELLTITLKATGATDVFIWQRVNHSNRFIPIAMLDDGAHGDGAAGDDVFGVSVTMQSEILEFYFYAEHSSAGVFSPTNAAHVYYTLEVPRNKPLKGELLINEFVASNNKSDINDYGIYTDWVELYNTTNKQLSLYGVYLSDNQASPRLFGFPAKTYIEPYSYAAVWADGLPSKRWMHAPFKLSSGGGQILLTDMAGQILDSFSYDTQYKDISRGRCPDGSNYFTSILTPSYLGSNNGFCVTALQETNIELFTVYPIPADDVIRINSNHNALQCTLTDIAGRMLWSNPLHTTSNEINIQYLENGIYFITCLDNTTGERFTKKIMIKH